ncbi:MAG TPA: hypothetical protein PKE62_00295 [Anaerolineales bacterium]|nr:hypothetical protein [Anaerolineales bacterium]
MSIHGKEFWLSRFWRDRVNENLFFATDFTDFHRFFYSNPRKSVKFVAEVLVFPLKTVEPEFSHANPVENGRAFLFTPLL